MGKECRTVERTCVACRTKGDQKDFVRYVIGPAQKVFVDYRHRLPGRGAYTCVKRSCIEMAISNKGFARAFRQDVAELGRNDLLDAVTDSIRQKILGLTGIARKAGSLVSGHSSLQAALEREDIRFMIIAEDASERSIARLCDLADQHGVDWARFSNQEELGKIVGRENRNCAGITDKQFAGILAQEINRLQQIVGEN